MQYIIDGHNLVPHVGLRLDAIDDEERLIYMLNEFCRRTRARADVFFDGAAPGFARSMTTGNIKAHFVLATITADAAIKTRLSKLGREASAWTVVSSDHAVAASAKTARAAWLSSAEFAHVVLSTPLPERDDAAHDKPIAENDAQYWLDRFAGNEPKPPSQPK